MNNNIMETTDFSKECGQRLRRIRMAKGMTQQDIADKFGTSYQNVSKWEKNGIHDIDTIKRLSEILGQDLLSDEIDEEGTVGEIGKYILKQIAENGGYLSVKDLVQSYMYGLSPDKTTNEIFKLERIGMCVREQYKNFYDQDKDMLFITAKGIITLKNMNLIKKYDSKSYEQILSKNSSVQECYDHREVEKLVRNLKYCGTYKVDYINYLKRKYINNTPIVDERAWKYEPMILYDTDNPEIIEYYQIDYYNPGSDIRYYYGVNSWLGPVPMLPGDSYYVDHLFRMITGLNDANLLGAAGDFIDYKNNYVKSIDYLEDKLEIGVHDYELDYELSYEDTILGNMSDLLRSCYDSAYYDLESEVEMQISDLMGSSDMDKLIKNISDLEKCSRFSEEDVDYFIEEANTFQEDLLPTDWFSNEEQLSFIEENYTWIQEKKTKEMLKIDEVLKQINELDPASLDYFNCSDAPSEVKTRFQKLYDLPPIS